MAPKRVFPDVDLHERVRTPWAVECLGYGGGGKSGNGPSCGLVYLSRDEYNAQLMAAGINWRCPICGMDATWNDDNHDEFYNEFDQD